MPASRGVQRPGRQHDGVGLGRQHLVDASISSLRTHRHLGPERPEIVDQVPGEAVVIVDERDVRHGNLPVCKRSRTGRGGAPRGQGEAPCRWPRRALELWHPDRLSDYRLGSERLVRASTPFEHGYRWTQTETPTVTAASRLTCRLCEREPIHMPGAIQPYGCLLLCGLPAWTVAGRLGQRGRLFGGTPRRCSTSRSTPCCRGKTRARSPQRPPVLHGVGRRRAAASTSPIDDGPDRYDLTRPHGRPRTPWWRSCPGRAPTRSRPTRPCWSRA